jgi:hypothetical protein
MTRSPSVAASLNQTPKAKWRQRLLEVTLDAKVVEIRTEPAICSIPLHQAIYCENCNTISNFSALSLWCFVAVKQFCG